MDLTEQPIPSETNCPNCGSSPTHESIVAHRLEATGYQHDDIRLECGDCGSRWTCGVPIGKELEYGDDLWCDACDDSVMFVHRVRIRSGGDEVSVHMKCPNCYYFDTVLRETDDGGVALMGYPDITGSFEGADPYGYKE